MASIIRIKRSSVAGNPATLAAGELAYSALADNGSNGGDRLYIGMGTEDTPGNAAVHLVIGGKYFTDMLDHTRGTLTASSALIVDADSKLNNLKVDNLELDGNTISSTDANGNIVIDPNGTGHVQVVADVLPSVDNTHDLGSSSLKFAEVHATQVNGGNLRLAVNTLSSQDTNGNVVIDPNGTGHVQVVADVLPSVDNTYDLGSSELKYAQVHATQVNGGNLRLAANTLSSQDTNGNVVLAPNGTGVISASSVRITNVADPTQAQDAATKSYVDATRSGLDFKDSVRVATTANLSATVAGTGSTRTLTNSGTQAALAIDSINLVVGNRVLVKDQTAGEDNGIYTVTTLGDGSTNWVLTRAADADSSAEVTSGMFVFVEEGTVNGNNGYVLTTDQPIDLDTTPLAFTQFSGAGQIVAGAGLTKTGNQLDIGAGNGITVNANDVALATTVAGAGLTYTDGVLAVVGTADRISVTADAIDIASTYVGQTSITTLGTVATGTWQATVISPTYGGTGVNNGTKTITLGGNLTTSGAFATTLTVTAETNVTLPTTGTLATLAGTETFTNKTLTSPTINSGSISGGSIDNTPIGATTRNTGAFTTLAANSAVTFTAGTASSSTGTGTLVVTGGVGVSGSVYVGVDLVGSGALTSDIDGFTIDGGVYTGA